MWIRYQRTDLSLVLVNWSLLKKQLFNLDTWSCPKIIQIWFCFPICIPEMEKKSQHYRPQTAFSHSSIKPVSSLIKLSIDTDVTNIYLTEINIILGKFNLSEVYRSNWMLWQIYNRQLQGWHGDQALFWYYLENLSEYVVTCLWICLKAFNAALYQFPGPTPINRFQQYFTDKGNTKKHYKKICLSAARAFSHC